MKNTVSFKLNGRPATLQYAEGTTLLWALRTQKALTGTKHGCGEGLCGACTVVVGGRAVRSCTTSVKAVAGKEVLTIEGLAKARQLHPLQQAFIDYGAVQCGFCTPGVLLSAYALLRTNPTPTRGEIAAALDDNLCRCGTHQRVLDAVEAAARQIGGQA